MARKLWMWSPQRREAIRNARIRPRTVKCQAPSPVSDCLREMREDAKPKLFHVDHINPASEPAKLIHDWDDFLHRLLDAPASELRVLCVKCHAEKTKKENQERKTGRRG